jgi:hypothetical protein
LDHIQACDAKLKMEEGKSIKPLAPWQMRALSNAIDVFEHQLSAELQKTASYSVPDKGIFHTEKLAESAEFHIHESIRSHLSPFALQEFRSAGRCLAFGLYSASGFHSTRAVEDVLRLYYEQFIGPPPDVPMGLLAGHLQDRLKSKDALPKPKENTVRHIRDVTNFDRNPLIHRGIELKEIDAMTLFNGALGVIVEMVKELSEADGQKPLPLQTEAIPLKRKGVTSAKTALLASPDEPPQS